MNRKINPDDRGPSGRPQTGNHAPEPEKPDAAGVSHTGHDTTGQNDVARLEAEIADLKDRLLRALAEAENVRRRAEKDVADTRQYAITKFAGDILSVADNLGRAINAIPAEARKAVGPIKTLIDGVEITERELLQVLERHGIRKLTPVGERFDPNFHEALFTVPDPAVPPGTVSKVVEPGYAIGSRPLRPAKVGVAAPPAPGAAD